MRDCSSHLSTKRHLSSSWKTLRLKDWPKGAGATYTATSLGRNFQLSEMDSNRFSSLKKPFHQGKCSLPLASDKNEDLPSQIRSTGANLESPRPQ